MSSLMLQLQHMTAFSKFFSKPPLPKTLVLTSQKICFKICSSILGLLPCLISFLFSQKLYTVDPQNQPTHVCRQGLLLPIADSQLNYIIPSNCRIIKIAPTHDFLPYSRTIAAFKEEVFSAFHTF